MPSTKLLVPLFTNLGMLWLSLLWMSSILYTKYDKKLKMFKWTGPKVKNAAAQYYGCKTKWMKGVGLQTTSPTEVGAHWNESLLNDELLTPVSGAEPEKVSPMTMAFMEDTKWYKANFDLVENYDFKKDHPKHCKM